MNQTQLAERFRDGATSGQTSNMFIEGGTLYSYGHHFPLTIRLDRGGYLHNGDRYSNTTSGHQAHARRAMNSPQIPFSALIVAGINSQRRFALEIVDETPDQRKWVCRCPGGKLHAYAVEQCKDGYTQHTLGGTLIRDGRRYLLAGIDFETSPANNPQFFLSLLPGKVTSIADAFKSLMPWQVKLAQALGADVTRQGDLFFVASSLLTRDLSAKGARQPIDVTRYVGTRRIDHHGAPLDQRESHLATEVRRLAGVRFARGTIRHGEHKMLRLGDVWHGVFANTARASWAASGRID